MKFLLMLMLFTSSNGQCVFYNTPTSQYYIVDVTSDPIQIVVLEENIQLPVSCIQNQSFNLQNIDFTDNSACLMTTLNQKFGFNIQHFADLKNTLTTEKMESLKHADIPTLLNTLFSISHSYSMNDLYRLYRQATKNEFRYEIHFFTYLKINEEYIPLSYPL